MAADYRVETRFLAISQRHIVLLTRNLWSERRITQTHRPGDQNRKFQKVKTTAILKNGYVYISQIATRPIAVKFVL